MLLLGAAAWRIELLGRFLEYDEIWTLTNYAVLNISGIFSDLATPNNHPLNSLLVKYLYTGNNWSLRLGSWFFSCASIIIGALIARRIYGKSAACYTFAALALLPPFVTAGCTARGYSGQLFFLLCFAYALLRCRKGDIAFTFLGAVSAVLATVSLPSSMLYIAPLGIFFLITMLKSKRLTRTHIYIFCTAALFAGCWYFRHWYDFQESGKFAVPVNSFAEAGLWLKDVCHGNGVFLPLLLAALVIKRKQRVTGILGVLFFLPLLMAYFTGAAPERVYLPGAAAAVMLCAPVKVRFRKWWFPAALAVQFAVSYSFLPDNTLERQVRKHENTSDIIPVYTATEGYVVGYNYPQAKNNFPRKVFYNSRRNKCTLQLISANSKISGLDKNGNSAYWDLPAGCGNTLQLHRSAVLYPGEIAFLLLPPVPQEYLPGILHSLNGAEMLKLNAWLTFVLNKNGKAHQFMLLALRSDRELHFHPQFPVFKMY